MRLPEGLNIEVTDSQYQMLYEVIMMAYELDVPEQKGWDMQTYDNMVDNLPKRIHLANRRNNKRS